MKVDMTPIRIEHEDLLGEAQTSIEISLGNVCNYACSYCPDNLHNGSKGWHDLDDVQDFLLRAVTHYGLNRVMVQYTGGEPTVYPGFGDLLKYGNDLGVVHSVISNGSRTHKWWRRFAPYLDKVHLTYHQEFADLEHFRGVVEIANQESRVHVNFTMIPERFDEILESARSLSTQDNTTITLKVLRVGFGSELYPYSEEQLDAMRQFHTAGKLEESLDRRGNMRVIHDNGAQIVKKPSQFLLDDDNHWEGWKCWVGIQELVVSPEGDIHRGICRVGGKLGNIRGDYQFPTKPIICNKAVCSCPTDIMTRKERVNSEA